MKTPYHLLIFCISAVTIFSSCTSKNAILNKNYETSSIRLYGKLMEVEIIDERKDVSNRAIKIPGITFPGQTDKVSPALTQLQRQAITTQIRSYFVEDDRGFKVKYRLLEGYQEFKANALNEVEYVYIEAAIELIDADGQMLQNCESNAFFETKSFDASSKFLDKLYEKAIRLAVYKCFEKITKGA